MFVTFVTFVIFVILGMFGCFGIDWLFKGGLLLIHCCNQLINCITPLLIAFSVNQLHCELLMQEIQQIIMN